MAYWHCKQCLFIANISDMQAKVGDLKVLKRDASSAERDQAGASGQQAFFRPPPAPVPNVAEQSDGARQVDVCLCYHCLCQSYKCACGVALRCFRLFAFATT
jgi:hypothetical protein